ncbi:MAG: DNRLRE domain-containing protein, partial [Anaerolineae bacterium]
MRGKWILVGSIVTVLLLALAAGFSGAQENSATPGELRYIMADAAPAVSATFYATGDTYVYEMAPASNYGSAPLMYVANYWGEEFHGDAWMLVRFSFSGYPSGVIYKTATLWLYQHGYTGDNVYRMIRICRAGSDWDAATVTWNSRPTGCNGYRTFTEAPGTAWRSYDVTSLVAGWLDGSVPNYGFSIWPESADEWAFIYRTYNWDSAHTYWPYLVVTYEYPTPTPTRTPTPTPTRTPTLTPTPT